MANSCVFGIVFAGGILLKTQDDHGYYIESATKLSGLSDVDFPNFLYQLILATTGSLFEGHFTFAAIGLLAALSGIIAVTIDLEIGRRQLAASPALRMMILTAILIASHIFLFTALVPSFYLGYISPVSYHSPTQHLTKALALPTVFLFGWLFLKSSERTLGLLAWLSCLCILTALAKPTFTIMFLPCAGLIALASLLRADPTSRMIGIDCAIWVLVPCTAVLIFQYGSYYAGVPVRGIEFRPFDVYLSYSNTVWEFVLKLVMSIAYPVAIAMLLPKSAFANVNWKFAILMLGFGLAYTLMLAEKGGVWTHGNFGWAAETAMFLVYVECVFVTMVASTAMNWRVRIAWSLFAIHVICGSIFAIASTTTNVLKFW